MVMAWPFALRGREWFGDMNIGPFWDLPPTFLFLYGFSVSLLFLVCGNGHLKGRNWSRALVLALCIVAILVSLIAYEKTPLFWLNLIWDLGFTGLLWFYLYRPHVTGFFRGEIPVEEG